MDPLKPKRTPRRLSKIQSMCLIILWCCLVYYILIHAERVDGMLILTILMSGCLVGIPIYKSWRTRK